VVLTVSFKDFASSIDHKEVPVMVKRRTLSVWLALALFAGLGSWKMNGLH
jgi:hypothetical protein